MRITVANYQIQPTDQNGEMIKFFNSKFNVDVQVMNIDHNKYHELINVRIAAGEIPDFFYLRDASTLPIYQKQGVLAALPAPVLRANAPDILNVINTYAPGYMDMGKLRGVQYGIPIVSPTNIFHLPLVYRADWLRKLGYAKPPETLAEFEKVMYDFANRDPDGNGRKDTYGLSKEGTLAVFGAFGINPYDTRNGVYWSIEGGRVLNSAVSPTARQGLALLAKWYKDGVLDPEFITGENQGGYWALSHAFIRGRIGFTSLGNYYHYQDNGSYITYNYDPATRQVVRGPSLAENNAKELKAANPNAELVFGMPLQGPTGARGMKAYNRLMNFVTIGKLAERVTGKMAKVLQIFNWASASPNPADRVMASWGIEGTHWVWADRDTEQFAILPPFNTETGYNHRIGSIFTREMPFPPKAPREQWAYQNQLDKYDIVSAVEVGLPLAVKYKSELNKIRDEAYIYMITGDRPITYFDEYVRKFMASGGAETEKEANDYLAEMKG
jgi:putative aldouronate transport system substrate-binding protein